MFKNATIDAGLVESSEFEDHVRRYFKEFKRKSIIITNVKKDISSKLIKLNLFGKISCLHLNVEKKELSSTLDRINEYPVTINVNPENFKSVIKTLINSNSEFTNLTINIDQEIDVKEILRIGNISKWGVHIYNNVKYIKQNETNCKTRLVLSFDKNGDAFPCIPLMKTKIGSLGNIKNPDEIKENYSSSNQIKIWFEEGPVFHKKEPEKGFSVCENHINDIIYTSKYIYEKEFNS